MPGAIYDEELDARAVVAFDPLVALTVNPPALAPATRMVGTQVLRNGEHQLSSGNVR
jgi:hypothetical protein